MWKAMLYESKIQDSVKGHTIEKGSSAAARGVGGGILLAGKEQDLKSGKILLCDPTMVDPRYDAFVKTERTLQHRNEL